MISSVAAPVYIPTSCVGGFSFLHTLSKFIICRLFSDGHADQGEVVPHYSFDTHFSGH